MSEAGSDLPDPLVPATCELRDFPFMPLDIARLFGSEFHARASDGGWRAGVTLWLRSWHQVPAGSLPKEDIDLCRLAELGRDIKTWQKLKAEALHGWKEAADGRLYHKVVAEKVLEAWIEKLLQRKSSGTGNAKKYGYSFDAGPIDAETDRACKLLSDLNPRSKALRKRARRESERHPDGLPPGDNSLPVGEDHAPDGSDYLPNKAPKGREETGKGIKNPLPGPYPEENKNQKNGFGAGRGPGGGKPYPVNSVTIENPEERIARFQKELVKKLGDDGWNVVIAAMDSKNPQHKKCLSLCKQAAQLMGKGWPHRWPIT